MRNTKAPQHLPGTRHLTLWFAEIPQSFWENVRRCVIHVARCRLHTVARDLPVTRGHQKAPQGTKSSLSQSFHHLAGAPSPTRSNIADAAPCLTELTEHPVSRGAWEDGRKKG